MDPALHHPLAGYVFISSAMFVLGIFTMVSRKNAIYVLGRPLEGQMFAIFIIILAAAEAAVALGIVLQLFQHFPTIDVTAPERLGD
jgi:NADH-quinone oxidoreductase subunit K